MNKIKESKIREEVLTNNFDGGGGHRLAVGVPGVAGVDAAVLRVDGQHVQGHVVEVVGGAEPVAGLEQGAVDCPLHSHGGVSSGCQASLQVDVLTLGSLDVLQRLREGGGHLQHFLL